MRSIAAAMIVLALASALGGCIIEDGGHGGHGGYGGGDYHWHPG